MATEKQLKEYISAILLFAVSENYNEQIFHDPAHTSKHFSFENLRNIAAHVVGVSIPENLCAIALKELELYGVFKRTPEPFSDDIYTLSEEFEEIYQHLQYKEGTPLYKCHNFGTDWARQSLRGILKEFENKEMESSNINENAEDIWEPLPLDRDSEVFKQAEEKLEKLIRAVESDNGYSANEPEERDNTVWSLKSGLELLKKHAPTKEQIISLIVLPAKQLSLRFKDATIGELAKQTVKFIFDLFRDLL